MLYFRQVVTLLVSLYTVRVVLNTLGVEDYGIYNVIGGVVALVSFLGGTMASATQRFFSFALGQNDDIRLKKTFTVNWIIYGAIAIIAFILLESVGLWYVHNQLKIPPERFEAALLLYHFSVLTFIATIFTTPFTAIIIAHENMEIYAYVSIGEAIMKLLVVFLLVYLPFDKLELYGVLLLTVAVVKALIYISVSSRKYEECQYRKFYWDKDLMKEILGFTGWTLFGQITTVFRKQAITILLNQVFTPVVVAARAIATNVASQISLFSSNFNVGLYPPIIKSYAANDQKQMFALIFNGSKITFFLMWVFALPMFIEMETVLHLWLKNPPTEAVLFTRLALVEVLINSISLPIVTAARAPGRMRLYELTLGTIQIAIFVAAWVVLKFGGAPYTVYIVAIIANLIMFIVRLIIVRKLIQLSLSIYFRRVVFPVFGVIVLSVIPSYIAFVKLPQGLFFDALNVLLCVAFSTFTMYFIGLDKNWREKVKGIVIGRLKRIF